MKNAQRNLTEAVLEDMNANLPGRLTMSDIARIRNGRPLRIPFIMNSELMSSDIACMELSVRAYNSLRRAGFNTVGDIVNGINSTEDLAKIRNCGRTSISEISCKLYAFQYSLIPKEKKQAYMLKIMRMNGINC